MARNLRALVRVLHCPKSQIDGRVKVFPKGSVFEASELGAEDIRHMLRQKTIEETDDPVGDAPVTTAPGVATPAVTPDVAPAVTPAVAPAVAPAAVVTGKPAPDAVTSASAG